MRTWELITGILCITLTILCILIVIGWIFSPTEFTLALITDDNSVELVRLVLNTTG